MANGQMPWQPLQVFLPECLGNKAHVGEITESAPVTGGYASALLAAVLEGKESVESNAGSVIGAGEICANNPAFLAWLVVLL